MHLIFKIHVIKNMHGCKNVLKISWSTQVKKNEGPKKHNFSEISIRFDGQIQPLQKISASSFKSEFFFSIGYINKVDTLVRSINGLLTNKICAFLILRLCKLRLCNDEFGKASRSDHMAYRLIYSSITQFWIWIMSCPTIFEFRRRVPSNCFTIKFSIDRLIHALIDLPLLPHGVLQGQI